MYEPWGQQPAETGAVVGVEVLADAQQGPTCGLEAVENVIQLFHRVPNTISGTTLFRAARRRGALVWDAEGPRLEPWAYPLLLADYGIQAEWHEFEAQMLVNAVQENRGVLAVVDAHWLRPRDYPSTGSWHAVVVTNVVADSSGRLVEFVGLDSNFPGTTQRWNAHAFERAASSWIYRPLLITTQLVRWRQKISHYLRQRDGSLIPIAG